MATLSFTQFLSLPRCYFKPELVGTVGLMLFSDHKSQSRWVLSARSKNKTEESVAPEPKNQESKVTRKTRTRRTTGSRKKAAIESEDAYGLLAGDSISEQDRPDQEELIGDSEKPKRRSRVKDAMTVKKMGRKSKKDALEVNDKGSETEVSDSEEHVYLAVDESDDTDIDMELEKGVEDDISLSYSWPPLVCCFGAAQHAFVPSGKPANRLIDYEIHDRLKDALWAPEKFIRAPGGSAGSAAIALAKIGGRVAFMGKLGDDDFGKAMLYYLNVSNVQTRSVSLDDKRLTAVSQVRLAKRGNLRTTHVKPCAEDSLSRSEINIDVLREAKMFYLNTSSLLDANMRKTTLRAVKMAKKLGKEIFYDLNLPLPLWHSSDETKSFIHQIWSLADFVEVTKQELEFLCGIKPSEEFDTKNNNRLKFVHYEEDVVAPLWHENLKVLFVTNGTSKIHYYTKEFNGSVHGMEDAPVTPFTKDMSASGDGIVAALMKMLTLQPHLITDKGYLEQTAKYAISCGVIDQWIVARQLGFPAKEEMDEDEEDIPDLNGLNSISEREFRTVMPVAS